MATLPVRRDAAPLAVRAPSAAVRTRPSMFSEAAALGSIAKDVLDALAKVSTPDDAALAKQQAAFNAMAAEQAELEREANALRDMQMQQLKKDDELLKKWIEMI